MPVEGLRMLRPASFGAPRGPYSPGVLAEAPTRLLYLAGQVPTDGEGGVVGEDFATQARRVFQNIGAVLAEAGMGFGNVVKFTNYLVDPSHLPELRAVRGELWPELFPDGAFPADTLLVVARLARPEFLLEIEAVAVECASR
ncbi:MAG TPA: RidA family protein [Acidimicrobiales bacterium]|nr:RidA family protein [Acidimicrobiales bacterium]